MSQHITPSLHHTITIYHYIKGGRCVYEARMTPPLTETWCYWCCALNTQRKFFQFLSGTATSDFLYHTRVILPLVFAAMVDVIFADVAQPDQARIVSINAQHFLKNQGNFVISIKVSLSVCLTFLCMQDPTYIQYCVPFIS